MNNLIYQYWDGKILPGVETGSKNMKEYAKRIGVSYLFEHNPKFRTDLGSYSPHYGSFKPIYDKTFHEYDNVLYVDTDVFAVEGLTENIFEGFNAEIGICTEPFQPKQRLKFSKGICSAMDKRWASMIKKQWKVEVPRTPENLLKVYNSGVVLYSNKGLMKANKNFLPFMSYIKLIRSNKIEVFYTADQNYLHAMLMVAGMDYIELDAGWNSYIHHYYLDSAKQKLNLNDSRNENTKFVHIQLRSADHWDADKLWRITNSPVVEWKL